MLIGITADHADFTLKRQLTKALANSGHKVVDFGPSSLNPEDDYPDYVVPLARNVASGEVGRGLAICGSGDGACVTANKVKGVRAANRFTTSSPRTRAWKTATWTSSASAARVFGCALAWDLTQAFVAARFNDAELHERRLKKVAALED